MRFLGGLGGLARMVGDAAARGLARSTRSGTGFWSDPYGSSFEALDRWFVNPLAELFGKESPAHEAERMYQDHLRDLEELERLGLDDWPDPPDPGGRRR